MLDHVSPEARHGVIEAMHVTLARWKAYRDDVAHAVGLNRRDAKLAS